MHNNKIEYITDELIFRGFLKRNTTGQEYFTTQNSRRYMFTNKKTDENFYYLKFEYIYLHKQRKEYYFAVSEKIIQKMAYKKKSFVMNYSYQLLLKSDLYISKRYGITGNMLLVQDAFAAECNTTKPNPNLNLATKDLIQITGIKRNKSTRSPIIIKKKNLAIIQMKDSFSDIPVDLMVSINGLMKFYKSQGLSELVFNDFKPIKRYVRLELKEDAKVNKAYHFTFMEHQENPIVIYNM